MKLVNNQNQEGSVILSSTVLADNQSGTELFRNEAVNQGSRHIDDRYHFTWNPIGEKQIKLKFFCIDKMAADIVTKPLRRTKTKNFSKMWGLPNINY